MNLVRAFRSHWRIAAGWLYQFRRGKYADLRSEELTTVINKILQECPPTR
jgi:hypothetical protein